MLSFDRLLTRAGDDPWNTVEWSTRQIEITDDKGEIIFSCPDAEFPTTWSDNACQITASKYFRQPRDASEEKETSLIQVVTRVVSAIREAGENLKYFKPEKAKVFEDELTAILIQQLASFNSPVWFNLGVKGVHKPQVSACFINEVKDNMESIMRLATTEALIFKEGSGSGTNFSGLRGSKERIRGGGTASGPVSFMQGYDGFANIILSGGRSRRAARMCILDVDHPDILKFITCKQEQEKIVESLVQKAGMESEFNKENNAYMFVHHQSGNNSVRVTDLFMDKVRNALQYDKDSEWALINRNDPTPVNPVSVRKLFRTLAEATHACGDPGIQFHDHINRMNTCREDGEIVASNPCSEFMWLNSSACNLSSMNLEKFSTGKLQFDTKKFKHVIRTMITAQDILVDIGYYPTKKITKNSHAYRPLGLGYANLGGLLMSWGIPYDSDTGRAYASAITSLMTGTAYLTSSELAATVGHFSRYDANRVSMEEVLDVHCYHTKKLPKAHAADITAKAVAVWNDVIGIGLGRRKSVKKGTGFRNSQVTLLAPTGTIAFMMDCATTGVEPDSSLVKYKSCVGGNVMKYHNPIMEKALQNLGYAKADVEKILEYVERDGHLENSRLHDEDLPVFDCAFPVGNRCLSVDGHIDMCAAIQPFISGAISKTYNLPSNATVEDIQQAYIRGWESGLKCMSVYRQGSKMSEPLRANRAKKEAVAKILPERKVLPDDRPGTEGHKFHIAEHTGYLHVGMDEEGNPMELFIRAAGFGSTVGGLLDSYATLFSKALQHGLPLELLIDHMIGSKFPPAGWTRNSSIPMAGSIMDYVARWMALKFMEGDIPKKLAETSKPILDEHIEISDLSEDPCPKCGHPLTRTGSCTTCRNCAYNSGSCG